MYCNSQNGQTFNEDEYWKIEGEIENQIFLHTMHEEENMEEDHSLKEMVDIHFEKYLNKLRSEKELKDEKVEIIKAIYYDRIKEEMSETACDDLNNVSVHGWCEFDDCRKVYTNLLNGFGQVIEYLASNTPKEKILLNTAVTKIEWPNAKDHVIVTTINEKDKPKSVFYGQQCICTMSLGCLKEKHKKIFEPELPPRTVFAIENLGFGVVNRVFIVFEDTPFSVIFGEKIFNLKTLKFDLYFKERRR